MQTSAAAGHRAPPACAGKGVKEGRKGLLQAAGGSDLLYGRERQGSEGLGREEGVKRAVAGAVGCCGAANRCGLTGGGRGRVLLSREESQDTEWKGQGGQRWYSAGRGGTAASVCVCAKTGGAAAFVL